MVADAFVRGAVAGLGIAMPVGAIALLIIDTGRRWHFRAAASAGLGAALADLIYATVAGVVGVAIAHVLSAHTAIIHWISGSVLGIVAARILMGALRRRTARIEPEQVPTRSRLTLTFLGLTLTNPLTVTYFAALVAGSSQHLGGSLLVPFVVGVFLASFGWQCVLAAFGTFLGVHVRTWSQRYVGVLGSLIIAILAARVAIGG